MDLPITDLTWPQLALGLWLIPLALNLLVYAPRYAAEIFADVQRARQGSYTTVKYGDVLGAFVVSAIPVINIILLIVDTSPYALERFGRFVGFVGDVLSKPIVPRSKEAPQPKVHGGHHIFADTRFVGVQDVDGKWVWAHCDEDWNPPDGLDDDIHAKFISAISQSWVDIQRSERNCRAEADPQVYEFDAAAKVKE